MSYITQQDLEDRFGTDMLVELTDRAEIATGVIDTDVVEAAISDTTATIDGYLRRRYALPLTPVDPMIAGLAKAIAIYNLHTRAMDPKIVDDYDRALKTLEKIAEGTIQLEAAAATNEDGGSSEGAQFTDRDRVFTDDTMDSYI